MKYDPKRFRAARKQQALTQVQLAHLVGVTSNSVESWEQGRRNPRPDAVDTMARFLDLTGAE